MKFRLSGEFGELSPVRDFRPHNGIDIAMPEGTTLRAVGEGVVDKVFDGTGAIGKGLSIKFDDGTRAIYGHLSDVKAKVGEHVDAGEIVGFSGNTGTNTTGAHLHFGMRDADGSWLDPTPLGKWFIERGKVDAYDGSKGIALGDHIGEQLADLISQGLGELIHGLTVIMPEIGAFLTILCAVAMMVTGNVSKWGVRWGIIMTGVITWIIGVR